MRFRRSRRDELNWQKTMAGGSCMKLSFVILCFGAILGFAMYLLSTDFRAMAMDCLHYRWRLLGIVWIGLGSTIGISAIWSGWFLWQDIFANPPDSRFYFSSDFFHLMLGPIYLLSAVVGFFLFRGARWAVITICIIAILTIILVVRGVVVYGFAPNWDCVLGVVAFIAAVVSIAMLPLQRRHHVAS